MTSLDVTRDGLEAARSALAGKGAVQMVNLLRYRAIADYGAGGEYSPCSGQEAYFQRYLPAFAKVASAVVPGETFSVWWVGGVLATLVPPTGETWHAIALVEYPSFEVLRRIIDSPEYKSDAAPHRRAALEDWRFIAAQKMNLPG
ncbi:conserved hypothetical protein [Methylocella silvestris BL2]|uniref:DUF1330 domain-containing protein n=1 Tax=Methylocella silvestris (strain DSM 15510 / CIP 108128 / LMG 27833 / NCIMB 13906 / BL2) TaxID=395965 RepID=B8EPS0_METSB|nr:hypothetical protein [Methylocella silvestris]ACK50924.1 conserved hypothetical protein [Methylocella silvestris BL2]